MLTALVTITGNDKDLTGVFFLPQLCCLAVIQSQAHESQAESMAEPARFVVEELVRSILAGDCQEEKFI